MSVDTGAVASANGRMALQGRLTIPQHLLALVEGVSVGDDALEHPAEFVSGAADVSTRSVVGPDGART